MSRYMVTLRSDADRALATKIINAAPIGARVEIKAVKRSGQQNDRMWAMLTDIALQLPWNGVPMRPDDWKIVFLDALKREMRTVPNLDGTDFVDIGRSSSDLSKAEMSDLMELMAAFGANHGVEFGDDEKAVA